MTHSGRSSDLGAGEAQADGRSSAADQPVPTSNASKTDDPDRERLVGAGSPASPIAASKASRPSVSKKSKSSKSRKLTSPADLANTPSVHQSGAKKSFALAPPTKVSADGLPQSKAEGPDPSSSEYISGLTDEVSGSSHVLTSSSGASGAKSGETSGLSAAAIEARLSDAFENHLNIDELEIRYDMSPEPESKLMKKFDKSLGRMTMKLHKKKAKM